MKLIRILIGGLLIVPFLGCSTYNTHKANEERIVLENKGCRETYKPGYPVELQDCELISKVISASRSRAALRLRKHGCIVTRAAVMTTKNKSNGRSQLRKRWLATGCCATSPS